jgi:hypothetical protein
MVGRCPALGQGPGQPGPDQGGQVPRLCQPPQVSALLFRPPGRRHLPAPPSQADEVHWRAAFRGGAGLQAHALPHHSGLKFVQSKYIKLKSYSNVPFIAIKFDPDTKESFQFFSLKLR